MKANNKQRTARGVHNVAVQNPHRVKSTLGMPGEQRRNMAKKKKKARSSAAKRGTKSRRNGKSTAIAKRGYTAKPARRNTARAKRNPMHKWLTVGGVKLPGVLVAGLSAFLTQAVSKAVPIGAPGSLVALAKDAALVFLVNKMWPSGFYAEYATAGAAAIPVANLVAAWLPGIKQTISNTIGQLTPGTQAPVNQQQANGPQVVSV